MGQSPLHLTVKLSEKKPTRLPVSFLVTHCDIETGSSELRDHLAHEEHLPRKINNKESEEERGTTEN